MYLFWSELTDVKEIEIFFHSQIKSFFSSPMKKYICFWKSFYFICEQISINDIVFHMVVFHIFYRHTPINYINVCATKQFRQKRFSTFVIILCCTHLKCVEMCVCKILITHWKIHCGGIFFRWVVGCFEKKKLYVVRFILRGWNPIKTKWGGLYIHFVFMTEQKILWLCKMPRLW